MISLIVFYLVVKTRLKKNEETKRGNANDTNTRLNYNLRTTKFPSHNQSTIFSNWQKVHVAGICILTS